jgi:dUTP pyrophosphatase
MTLQEGSTEEETETTLDEVPEETNETPEETHQISHEVMVLQQHNGQQYNEYGYRSPTYEEQVQRTAKYFRKGQCPCKKKWYSPSDTCDTCILKWISKYEDDKKSETFREQEQGYPKAYGIKSKQEPPYLQPPRYPVVRRIPPEILEEIYQHTRTFYGLTAQNFLKALDPTGRRNINHHRDPITKKDYEGFVEQDYGTSTTAGVYGIEWSPPVVQVITMGTAVLPERKTDEAVGYDLYSYESIILHPGSSSWIRTGVKMKIPIGLEGRIQGRSGDAKKGLEVRLGCIDPDYRGEIRVYIRNVGNQTQYIAC